MTAPLTDEEIIRALDALEDKAAAIIDGENSMVVGLLLAKLVATWIASYPKDKRGPAITVMLVNMQHVVDILDAQDAAAREKQRGH